MRIFPSHRHWPVPKCEDIPAVDFPAEIWERVGVFQPGSGHEVSGSVLGLSHSTEYSSLPGRKRYFHGPPQQNNDIKVTNI